MKSDQDHQRLRLTAEFMGLQSDALLLFTRYRDLGVPVPFELAAFCSAHTGQQPTIPPAQPPAPKRQRRRNKAAQPQPQVGTWDAPVASQWQPPSVQRTPHMPGGMVVQPGLQPQPAATVMPQPQPQPAATTVPQPAPSVPFHHRKAYVSRPAGETMQMAVAFFRQHAEATVGQFRKYLGRSAKTAYDFLTKHPEAFEVTRSEPIGANATATRQYWRMRPDFVANAAWGMIPATATK